MSGPAPTVDSTVGSVLTRRRSLKWWAAITFWLLVCLGLMLRFTVRDRYQPAAILFYCLPRPCLAALAALATLLGNGHQRNGHAKRASWICVAILALFTLWGDFGFRKRPGGHDGVRIVFWNVAHGYTGLTRIAREIRRWNAPVVALVEADSYVDGITEQWRGELAGYDVADAHFGGLLAVRGHVLSKQWHSLSSTSYCDQFDVLIDGEEFTIFLVDVASTIAASRQKPLEELANLAAQIDRPLVILGDFNTPDDSIWFAPLERSCRQAFRDGGFGYGPTWPMPAPVLLLDQVWVNSKVGVDGCSSGWSLLSDHRPVFVELKLNSGRTE